MLAYRDLSEEQWEVWAERFRGAEKATDFREDRLADAYEEIEQDMMVLYHNRWFGKTVYTVRGLCTTNLDNVLTCRYNILSRIVFLGVGYVKSHCTNLN